MTRTSAHLTVVAACVLSACAGARTKPGAISPNPDVTHVIEELVLFHKGVLGDTTRIDACSIQQATNDPTILTRLSQRALAGITRPTDCQGNNTENRRALVSLSQSMDSVIANVEVVNGQYVHMASYRGRADPASGSVGFHSITLFNFAVRGTLPPSPPPR